MRSLAVLPFVNEGADPELDYLGDGIADTLIHDLSQLREVRVMARSTVFRYRGPTVEPRAVGRDLKVDAVLTGRVLPRGELLTVEVELVDVASGSRLWGERYQGSFARVMRVPEEIAREISSTLQLRLTHEQEARLARRETEDPEAYRLYLKGRFHWNKRTGDGFRRAVGFFEEAIARDPAYALPHVGLADTYALMAAYSVSPPGQSMPRARAAAERALELDDQLAEAHATLGLVKLLYDWDQGESEKRFRRATSLKPGLASGHHWFAELLMASGRTDEALAELGRAEELDPLSLIVPTDRGRALFFARRYDRALAECQRSLDADRAYAPALITRGMVLEELGRYEEALVGYRQVASLTGDPQHATMIARALALSGDRPGALRLLADIERQARDRYVSPYSLALVHAVARPGRRSVPAAGPRARGALLLDGVRRGQPAARLAACGPALRGGPSPGRPRAALTWALRRRRAGRTRCRRRAAPRNTRSSRACRRGTGRTGASRRAGSPPARRTRAGSAPRARAVRARRGTGAPRP